MRHSRLELSSLGHFRLGVVFLISTFSGGYYDLKMPVSFLNCLLEFQDLIYFLEHQISLMLEEARFLVDINVHSTVDSLARRAFCKFFSSACLLSANPSCFLVDHLNWAVLTMWLC